MWDFCCQWIFCKQIMHLRVKGQNPFARGHRSVSNNSKFQFIGEFGRCLGPLVMKGLANCRL